MATQQIGPHSFCAANGDPTNWSSVVVCSKWRPNKLVLIRCVQQMAAQQIGSHLLQTTFLRIARKKALEGQTNSLWYAKKNHLSARLKYIKDLIKLHLTFEGIGPII